MKPDLAPSDHHSGPTNHRGLDYPLGDRVPQPCETIEIAAGVHWARLPVPGPLKHINVWLAEEDGGVAVIDTGLPLEPCKEAWRTILEGRTVTRVIVTHMHPDHLGLAGWLTKKHGVRLWMTRGEYLTARLLVADARPKPPEDVVAMWTGAGWSDEQVAAATAKGWGMFAAAVHRLPDGYVRVQEGDEVGRWHAVLVNGHSPEHLCLIDERAKIIIAGDQVLPRISSNVSLTMLEPEADPLADWLDSLERLRAELPGDLLVLPAHGSPFTGVHTRLDALIAGHHIQLDRLEERLREAPRRAVDCFGAIFARPIDDKLLGMATGETLAHLRWLERRGRAAVRMRDGVAWWSAGVS